MPIATEKDTKFEQMRKIQDSFARCADCGSRLVLVWGGAYGYDCHILICGSKDLNHVTYTTHDKKREAEIEQIRRDRKVDSKSLMTMDEASMIQRVQTAVAKWPQEMDARAIKLLAKVAITYGLDPLMSEVVLYQGRPFIGIDGRYRKAQETGRLMGVETRPATEEERKAWKIPEADYFFRSTVKAKPDKASDFVAEFIGWGRVRAAEMDTPASGKGGFRPLEVNPQRMAEKRAEAQALRKAFHIPLPSAEEIGSGEHIDEDTGEIIEGEATVIEEPRQSGEAEPEQPVEDIPVGETEKPAKEKKAEKDERPVNKDEITRLHSYMTKQNITPTDVGSICNSEKGWGVKNLSELMKWQYDELVEKLEGIYGKMQ